MHINTAMEWSVTCHMGSHSVTCHPTQVNAEIAYPPADRHPSKY